MDREGQEGSNIGKFDLSQGGWGEFSGAARRPFANPHAGAAVCRSTPLERFLSSLTSSLAQTFCRSSPSFEAACHSVHHRQIFAPVSQHERGVAGGRRRGESDSGMASSREYKRRQKPRRVSGFVILSIGGRFRQTTTDAVQLCRERTLLLAV